jgi:hypothetical protein
MYKSAIKNRDPLLTIIRLHRRFARKTNKVDPRTVFLLRTYTKHVIVCFVHRAV